MPHLGGVGMWILLFGKTAVCSLSKGGEDDTVRPKRRVPAIYGEKLLRKTPNWATAL